MRGKSMEINKFSKELKELSGRINIDLSEEKIEKFYNYMNLLLEWNEKMNLTAIKDESEIILKHFIDSLTIAKYINNEASVADIGTGAGFPGIPLKINNESIDITLVDSLNKRLVFLEEIINKLNLENSKTIHTRAEDLGKNGYHREKYDIVVSRAVANLTELAEYALPLVKVGGECICMKGPKAEEEILESRIMISKLGGKIEKVEELILPESDIKRTIIIITKERKTPNEFPRSSQKIKRKK